MESTTYTNPQPAILYEEQLDVKELLATASLLDSLESVKSKIEQLLEAAEKLIPKQDKKGKTNNKKQLKQERIYQVDELHKDFVKKHQINEPINETQLEGNLQYYFDLLSGNMKPVKDEFKKWLHLPDKEFSIIKKAFEENKLNVVPKKEDLKYFIELLENKKTTVDFNNNTYSLLDLDSLLNNKDLFSMSTNNHKIRPKVFYTINPAFCRVLQELNVLPQSFDCYKPYLHSTLEEYFNKYNLNNIELYQAIDLKNKSLLDSLDLTPDNYVVTDLIYLRPKVLKDHLLSCCDNGKLLDKYLTRLEEFKVMNLNELNGKLKNLSLSQ